MKRSKAENTKEKEQKALKLNSQCSIGAAKLSFLFDFGLHLTTYSVRT
jgi:hypothetical protein